MPRNAHYYYFVVAYAHHDIELNAAKSIIIPYNAITAQFESGLTLRLNIAAARSCFMAA